MTVSQTPLSPDPVGSTVASNFFCMVSMLTWALAFPAAELLLRNWSPEALIVARLLLAIATIVPIWIAVDGLEIFFRSPWLKGLVVGGLGFGIGTYLLLLGQAVADAVTVAIVASSMPVAGAVVEVLLDGRRLTPRLVTGVVLALVGGIVAAGASLSEAGFGFGALCALISVVTFVWGSRAAVKQLSGISAIGQTAMTLTGATLFCLIIFLVLRVTGVLTQGFQPLSGQGWLMLILYGAVAMALSQVFWLMGVKGLGIAVASLHINSASFYGMFLMVLLLGAEWQPRQVVGALILASWVLIAQSRRRMPTPIQAVPKE